MPTANGPPMDTAQTSPMNGDAMGLFIWSVQAQRCRNGSRSSSGGRASSPTAAGPDITSGSSFGAVLRNPVPAHRVCGSQTSRSDQPLLSPEASEGIVVVGRDLDIPGGAVQALGVRLLGTGVEAGPLVAQVHDRVFERPQER